MCRSISRKPLHRYLLPKLGNYSFPCVFKAVSHQELSDLLLCLVKRNPPAANLRDALENRIATLHSDGTRDFSRPERQHLRLIFRTHHVALELTDLRLVSVVFGHMLLCQVLNRFSATNPVNQPFTQRISSTIRFDNLARFAFAFLKGKKQLSH